jgi:DNA-binding GntR family transcriptional regulator
MLQGRMGGIHQNIKEKILNGVYQPGQALGEVPLAAEYGINRSLLRQVFQKLESETLVVRIPNRGTFVKSITGKDLQNIFQIREALEGMAARLAARNGRDEELDAVAAAFAKCKEDATNNLPEKLVVGEQFHQFVLKSCGNSMICDTMAPLKLHITRTWNTGLNIPDRVNKAFKEHVEILAAFKDKNEDLAELKMREHISGAFRDYIKITILNEGNV